MYYTLIARAVTYREPLWYPTYPLSVLPLKGAAHLGWHI